MDLQEFLCFPSLQSLYFISLFSIGLRAYRFGTVYSASPIYFKSYKTFTIVVPALCELGLRVREYSYQAMI